MAAVDHDFYDELVAADGQPRAHARTLVEALETLGAEALIAAGRRRDAIFMQQGITFDAGGPDSGPVRDRPFPLDLVPRIIPADEWTDDQARPRAADPRAQPLRRRRLPRARDHPRRQGAVGPGRLAARVRPRRARHPPARRRLLPRLRLRPRARLRRRLEGARGQRPHAVGHLLRAREPARDDAPAARPLRALPGAARRPLPGAAAHRARGGRADRRGGGGDGRRLDARPVQQRLLRARLPRAPDGRRAGRGVRPRGPRRRLPHPHHPRPAARARDLPADRRRLHGPARVPPRLDARRAGPDARLPRGQRRDRQRRRHRRRRRQGDLPLRAGDDPLLPRRGAAAAERADVPDGRSRAARVDPRAAGRGRGQADERVRRQGRLHRPARERGGAGPPGGGAQAHAGALDRAGARAPLDRADDRAGRPARAPARRPAPVRRLRRGHPHRPGRAHARRRCARAR